ncbi:MAG: hypothetical protein OXT06_09015 [Rhodospirillaceae bacterium]|nr:hypothetical protein [Rhodospirillaceae bacterium]MDD9915784.1 hypothetical protein [Rhodospirillaceae bacterium]MDD9924913.1 hypothetical protein [Rhodospirillaceae bacterium]
MLTEDEKLRSEILNLFKYIQKMREEIAQVHVRMDERTHFESASEHLDEIVAATEKATDSILENLEEIDSVADQIREGGDASALCDQINEKTMAAIECCTFQDITGQRVGKIVKSLQFVEERIDAMVALWGRDDIESVMEEIGMEMEMPEGDEALLNGPQLPGESISQDDIDKLFA